MRRYLLFLGALNLAALTARSALSYFLVSNVPFGISQPNEQAFFDRLGHGVAFLGPSAQEIVSGNNIFRNEIYFVIAATLPLVLSTAIFVTSLILLIRNRVRLTDDLVRLLLIWAIVFACVSALAFPVFAQDFWLSVGWGRMAASGLNPYYFDLPLDLTRDLPLDYSLGRMTYGPLWAVICGILAWVSGGSIATEALVFKTILIAALIGSYYLVLRILADRSLMAQCFGIMMVGWLPLAATEIAAEGHNDIVMVFFLLLWVYLLKKGKVTAASVALAASVLIKYVTAPLFLLEILYVLFSLKRPFRTLLLPIASAGLLALVTFAIFVRSTDFFAAASSMSSWHFFTPRDAIGFVCRSLGLPPRLQYLPFLIFPSVALYNIYLYFRERTLDAFVFAVLGVMMAILFTAPGHIFPWYMVWVVPLSVLVPSTLMSRWNIGAALAFPFAVIPLQLTSLSGKLRWDVPGLLIFLFAIVWLLSTIRLSYLFRESRICPAETAETNTLSN